MTASSKILTLALLLVLSQTVFSSSLLTSQFAFEIVTAALARPGSVRWDNLQTRLRSQHETIALRPLLAMGKFYENIEKVRFSDALQSGFQALQNGIDSEISPAVQEVFLYHLNSIAQKEGQGLMIPAQWRYDMIDWFLPTADELMLSVANLNQATSVESAQFYLHQSWLVTECANLRSSWLKNQSTLPARPGNTEFAKTCLNLLFQGLKYSISHHTTLMIHEWMALLHYANDQTELAIRSVDIAHSRHDHPRLHALSALLYLSRPDFAMATYHKNRMKTLEPHRVLPIPEPEVSALPVTPATPVAPISDDKWDLIRARIKSIQPQTPVTASISSLAETVSVTSQIESTQPLPIASAAIASAPEVEISTAPLLPTTPVAPRQERPSLIPPANEESWESVMQVMLTQESALKERNSRDNLLVYCMVKSDKENLKRILALGGGRIQDPLLLEKLHLLMSAQARPAELSERYPLWLLIAQRLPAELLARLRIRLVIWNSLLGAAHLKLTPSEAEILSSLATDGLLGTIYESLQKSQTTSK